MSEQAEPHRWKSWLVPLIFLCVSAGFMVYRQGACIVWNDSPNTCWYLYDRQDTASLPPVLSYLRSFFAKMDPSGYRPISSLIYDIGMRTITDPCNPPLIWIAHIAAMYGGLASLIYLVARRFTSSTAAALFATMLYLLSPPVTAASWVLFAGLQPLVIMTICAGLLLYWKGLKTTGIKRHLCFVGLAFMMLIGPWIREFCGLLPVLILVLEAQRVHKPSWLGLMSALFFCHSLYPAFIPSLTIAHGVAVKNIFQMGSLGTQATKTETEAANLLLYIWKNVRWFVPRRFLELFPPLLFAMASLSMVAQILDKRLRGSSLWTAAACAFLGILLLGLLKIVPGTFTALWITTGLSLLAARYSPFLAIWFLLSFLPFLKVYTEHVHLAYALAPASIILARGAEDFWQSLSGPSRPRLVMRMLLAAILAVALLDQGAAALASRSVVLGACDGFKTVALQLRERIPQGSAVIGNALHLEDVRLYSENYFQAFWTVSAGVPRARGNLETPTAFKQFYQEHITQRPIYLLDMEHAGLFPTKLYHRNRYVHSMNLPKTSLGTLHSMVVRYRFYDPLRMLTKSEDIPFLGPPDEVNDYYTGPARDGSLFMRETSITYHLYALDRDPQLFLAALDPIAEDYVPDHLPIMVKEGYCGYNLLRFGGRFYAVKQGVGFDPNAWGRQYPANAFYEADDIDALTEKVNKASTSPLQ